MGGAVSARDSDPVVKTRAMREPRRGAVVWGPGIAVAECSVSVETSSLGALPWSPDPWDRAQADIPNTRIICLSMVDERTITTFVVVD